MFHLNDNGDDVDEREDDDNDDDDDDDDDDDAVIFGMGGGPPPPNLSAMSNTRHVDVPPSSHDGGIILDSDTSVTAMKKLVKYASAGNVQAVYM